jgi:hypothetical protein
MPEKRSGKKISCQQIRNIKKGKDWLRQNGFRIIRIIGKNTAESTRKKLRETDLFRKLETSEKESLSANPSVLQRWTREIAVKLALPGNIGSFRWLQRWTR